MRRSKKILSICIALFILICFSCSDKTDAQSSSAEKLVNVLPDDVLGFVTTSGGDSLKPDFEKTILGRIYNDQGVRTFYDSVKKELLPKMRQEMGNQDSKIFDIVKEFAGLIATRPVIIGAAQKNTQEGPPIYGFAILDAGQRKEKIASALTSLESMADEDDIVEVKIGSYTLHGPGDAGDVPGYWGWIGNYLVFAINDGEGLAVKYLQDNNRPMPNYLQKIPGSGDALAVYLNIEKGIDLISSIAKMEGEEEDFAKVRSFLDELGINSMKTISSRIGFESSNIVVDEFVELSQPRSGLFANFKTINLDIFNMVSDNSVNASAFNCDIAGIYDTFMRAIKVVAGEDFDEVEEMIAKVEEETGVKIRNGLLESLNGEMAFYAMQGGGSLTSMQGGMVLIAKLNDAKLWQYSIDALGKFAAAQSDGMLQVSTQEQDGRTTHTWAVTPLAMAQIMPTWTIIGDNVVIASNPMTLDTAIEQINSGTQSIRTAEGFRKATSNLPTNLMTFDYTDSKIQLTQMMVGLQQIWPMATMFAAKEGIKLPIVLPSLTHIIQDVSPSYYYSWSDDQGIRSHYKGAGIELSLGAVAGGAFGLGIMMPALARVRQQAQGVVSMTNLKQIGLASIMYADDYDGILPSNFEQMNKYIGNTKILESPLKPKGFSGPSYIYVGGRSIKDSKSPEQDILAYENTEYCGDIITTLFLDGHVEKVPKARFLSLIKGTYEALGKPMPEIKFRN